MKKRLAVVGLVGVVAAAVSGSAWADPVPNQHNCAGLSSTFVPPGFGQEVAGIAHLFPTGVPTSLDFANCGGNGFPPHST
jgi:hypothetical protein